MLLLTYLKSMNQNEKKRWINVSFCSVFLFTLEFKIDNKNVYFIFFLNTLEQFSHKNHIKRVISLQYMHIIPHIIKKKHYIKNIN